MVSAISIAGYTLILFSHTYRGMSIGNSIFLAGTWLNGYKCDCDYFENFWNYENPSCKTAVLTTDGDKIIYTKEYEQLVDNKGRYMGCYYAKPMPVEEFRILLQQHSYRDIMNVTEK